LAFHIHHHRLLVVVDVELQSCEGLVVLVEQIQLVAPADVDLRQRLAVRVLSLQLAEVLFRLQRHLDPGAGLTMT
jgi:hypothetical protein